MLLEGSASRLFAAHGTAASDVAWSPGDRFVVSTGGDDCSVIIWRHLIEPDSAEVAERKRLAAQAKVGMKSLEDTLPSSEQNEEQKWEMLEGEKFKNSPEEVDKTKQGIETSLDEQNTGAPVSFEESSEGPGTKDDAESSGDSDPQLKDVTVVKDVNGDVVLQKPPQKFLDEGDQNQNVSLNKGDGSALSEKPSKESLDDKYENGNESA